MKTAEPTRRSVASIGEASRGDCGHRVGNLKVVDRFGALIRRRREELGLSYSRVGELVGRAPSTVRAWERGQAVPADPHVLRSLAAILDIDEGSLFAIAGLEAPIVEPSLTIEQALASIAPHEDGQGSGWGQVPLVADEDGEGGSLLSRGVSLIRALRWTGRRRASAPSRRRTSEPGPAWAGGAGSYLDDPDERATYRRRALQTALGVGVSVVVGVLAVRGLVSILGDVWTTLTQAF